MCESGLLSNLVPHFVVISDLDGTLTTQQSSWQFVFEELGLWYGRGEKHLHLFLDGKISYDEFIKMDVALLKDVPVQKYLETIDKITFRKGLVELFDFLKGYNSENIIVSSGLMDLAKRLGNYIPIKQIYANEINHTHGLLDGTYTCKVGWHGKEQIMKKLKLAYPDRFIIAFGDTSGDLPLIKYSDLSFSCFSSSDELNAQADYVITDLKDAISIINRTIRDY